MLAQLPTVERLGCSKGAKQMSDPSSDPLEGTVQGGQDRLRVGG